jgi:glycosyltransferase involved in cell wall biosynthesis
VVVDTGSVDRTREIARDFGAKVFDFAWIDDFAAARNEALAHATGDYAFWLDADDVEAEACLRRILGLKRPEQFCSFNQGIYGHVTRRNLAEVAAERGDHAEAARLWNEVLAECPGDRQALANLETLRRSSRGETP